MSLGSYLFTQGTYTGYTELKIDEEVIGSITYGERMMEPGEVPDYITIVLNPRYMGTQWTLGKVEMDASIDSAVIRLDRRRKKNE